MECGLWKVWGHLTAGSFFKKMVSRGPKGALQSKAAFASAFGPQNPQGSSSLLPTFPLPFWSLWSPSTYMVHLHTLRQNTHTHQINTNLNGCDWEHSSTDRCTSVPVARAHSQDLISACRKARKEDLKKSGIFPIIPHPSVTVVQHLSPSVPTTITSLSSVYYCEHRVQCGLSEAPLSL